MQNSYRALSRLDDEERAAYGGQGALLLRGNLFRHAAALLLKTDFIESTGPDDQVERRYGDEAKPSSEAPDARRISRHRQDHA